MKKKLFLYLWLLTPVVLLAYHYGPGQTELARDYAREKVALAQKLEQDENWRAATDAYADALAKLPGSDKSTRWAVRLAQSKTRMMSGDLPKRLAKWKGCSARCRGKTQRPDKSPPSVKISGAPSITLRG
jgi:hypothetical protein